MNARKKIEQVSFLLQSAVGAHQRMAFTEAARGYEEILKLESRNPDALHLLGVLRQQTGLAAEAEVLIRRAIEVRASPVYLSNLGNLLRLSQRLVDAEVMYRRALKLDPKLADAFHGLGLLLKATKRFSEAEAAYRSAVAIDPLNGDAQVNLGILLTEMGRNSDAQAIYEHAVKVNPRNALAYFNLAILFDKLGLTSEAEFAYLKALELRPDVAEVHLNFGTLLSRSGRYRQAEASYKRALAIQPKYADAHINLANLFIRTERLADAEKAYREALSIAPNSVEGRAYLGFLLLSLGQFSEGWALHEVRTEGDLIPARYKQPVPSFKRWSGERLVGKSLLVIMEQGYGDAIQFARYTALLRVSGVTKLTLACKRELHALLETLANIDDVVATVNDAATHDFWCFSMSLPFHYETTLSSIPATIPYLRAPGERLVKCQHSSNRLRVGLVWRGNPEHSNDRNRSISDFTALAPFWSVEGIDFVSLQRGPSEIEPLEVTAAQPTLKLEADGKDFAATASIVDQLDLVICVDTAVAHLSGALGKPTWVLLPAIGTDWRWLRDRDDSPWYPGVMRLFRQTTAGDWDDTIAHVTKALEFWAKGRSIRSRHASHPCSVEDCRQIRDTPNNI